MSKVRKPVVSLDLHKNIRVSDALRKEVGRHGPDAVISNRCGGVSFQQLQQSDPEEADRLGPVVESILACAT